jgi:spore coat polysaccharide biosynthesis protein SpsF
MGSTRLPGKVLMDVSGAPMLAQQLRRLQRAQSLDSIVVATSDRPDDDRIVEAARAAGVDAFRGSETDVLARCLGAARASRADVVVRVTADCPLIDGSVVDRVCRSLTGDVDYAANVIRRTFPQGLDVEALHLDVLERVARMASSDAAREHVTWFVYRERHDLFEIASVEDSQDNSDLRWTVDRLSDLELVRELYRQLSLGEQPLAYLDIVQHVRAHPELRAAADAPPSE